MEIQDCKKEYASKNVAGAGLGLGIAGTALGLMNSGWFNGNGLFGYNRQGTPCDNPMYLERKECKDYLDATTRYYEGQLDSQKELAKTFVTLNGKLEDDAFRLYRNQRDSYDLLNKRISDLECKQAITDAVEPWRSKVLDMQINQVNSNAMNGLALEAERRCCADNKIVNYANCTFVPKQIGTVTASEPFVPADTYNPLCGCCK